MAIHTHAEEEFQGQQYKNHLMEHWPSGAPLEKLADLFLSLLLSFPSCLFGEHIPKFLLRQTHSDSTVVKLWKGPIIIKYTHTQDTNPLRQSSWKQQKDLNVD